MRLSDYKVLSFDCYGTLIDWERGMVAALKPLTDRLGGRLSRDQVLAAHEVAQQRTTPQRLYRDLLAVVYKRLAEKWGVPAPWEECVRYGLSVRDWPAFGDSAAALKYLKRHHKLVILSNVDNDTFAHSNRKLDVTFDAVLTAEDIGSYKPSARNFSYLVETLGGYGYAKRDILHVAESLFHDHQPANTAGLASCWIHRRHAEGGFGATGAPGAMPTYDARFTSMAELAAAHRAEIAAPA